jgi:hypothetical protein
VTRGYLASLAEARADSDRERDEQARAEATPCTPEESLLAVSLILDRLHETVTPVDELDTLDRIADDEPFTCQECDRPVERLYAYGAFHLCRRCVTLRLEIAGPGFTPRGATPNRAGERPTRERKPRVGDPDYCEQLRKRGRKAPDPYGYCELCQSGPHASGDPHKGELCADGRYFCTPCARANTWGKTGTAPTTTERPAA